MTQIIHLENWFESKCDQSWEHEWGIKIESLDNPGWKLTVPIMGTVLEERVFEEIQFERSEMNWVVCKVEGGYFTGYGGVKNLSELIDIFFTSVNKK